MRAKDIVGRRGEDIAGTYLEACGLRILDRNWRCRDGEIDLVALDGAVVVIVEVKARTSLAYGHPFEAVNARKLARLNRLAAAWCRDHLAGVPPWRIDVVGVLYDDDAGGDPVIEHLQGVV